MQTLGLEGSVASFGTKQAGKAEGLILVLAATLSVAGVIVLSPILPKLVAAYADVPGIAIIAPLIMTLPALCVALFSPVAGWLCDRFGAVRLLSIAFAAYAPFGMAPLFVTDLNLIIATRVGVGLTEAIVMTASVALIGDYFTGASRDRWLSLQVGTAAISAVLLLLVAGTLGSVHWRAPFLIYGGSVVLLALSLKFLWQPGAVLESRGASEAGIPWSALLPVAALTLFGGILFYIVPVQMGFILEAEGVSSPAVIGQVSALGAAAIPLGAFAFSRSRARAPWLLAGAFLLTGVGFLIVSQTRSVSFTMVGVVVNQFGCGLFLPCLLAAAMAGLPETVRGRGMGIWTGAFFAGQFFSPLAFFVFSSRFGGLKGALEILGGCGLLLSVGCFALALSRNRPALRAAGNN